MERAILVSLSTNRQEKLVAEESIKELEGLVCAAGAQVIQKIFQYRSTISPKYFIGAGKAEEIGRLVEDLQTDLIIFDHNLSPGQQRNLEAKLQCKVIDRTQLILDIFAQRAKSNEGKLQVELAQLNYLLPRLAGKGIALSRLGGGIGTRGPGEKKLEEDRRRILDRITKIKRDIARIQKRRANQRKSRKESPIPTVSLVGYTSAGKSTLFNQLARESTFTSPQLFATLDPVLRRITYPDGLYFFLSDTVGFIKKLPVELITSFRATLEEVKESDCLLHVIDITASNYQSQIEAVEEILADIGVKDTPVVKVYNKIDLLPEKEELLKRNNFSDQNSIYLSAKTGEGVENLKAKLRPLLFKDLKLYYLRIPKEKRDIMNSFSKWSLVLKTRENSDFYEVKVMANPQFAINYLPYLSRGGENW